MGGAEQAATVVLALFWGLIAAGFVLLACRAFGMTRRQAAPRLAGLVRRRLSSGPESRRT